MSKNNKQFIYHTKTFKSFIESSFNCKYEFIKTEKQKEIIAIFPFSTVKSLIFGNRIISAPYQEYGGLCGDKTNFQEIIEVIKKKYSLDFDYLEIKGSIIGEQNPTEKECHNLGLIKAIRYKRFVLPLSSEKEIWENIQKSKRKAIKKSQKSGTCRLLNIYDLDSFYELYLENMRRFGSPPYSKKYFINYFEMIESKGYGRIYGTFVDNKLVSALLGFTYNNIVHITTAISNPKYAAARPSDLMHWEFIQWSIKNNYNSFDFGLVREESGQFEYKRKWGAELKELPSYFLLLNSKEIPTVLDPSNSKYKLVIKIWQYLPLKITEFFGMRIRKELGM